MSHTPNSRDIKIVFVFVAHEMLPYNLIRRCFQCFSPFKQKNLALFYKKAISSACLLLTYANKIFRNGNDLRFLNPPHIKRHPSHESLPVNSKGLDMLTNPICQCSQLQLPIPVGICPLVSIRDDFLMRSHSHNFNCA